MTEKDHLDLMRGFGQLEAGQKSLGARVTDFERRIVDELSRLREDFRSALGEAVTEMRKAHETRDIENRAIEKRVSNLENSNSHHDGAWSVGSRTLAGVGMLFLTVINALFAWFSAHASK